MLKSNSCMTLDYIRDAFERSVLFMDVLRQRGNDYLEQRSRTAPHVLNFEFKLLIDGRTLPNSRQLRAGHYPYRFVPELSWTSESRSAASS